jgi:CRP/FNR family cyclic AMP-dependent transcriptional regulator
MPTTATDVLALCAGLPVRELAAGETLIDEGVRTDRLYVLRSGAFDVVRGGVRVVTLREPGAFMGEISALLGTPPTATVTATEPSTVHEVDHAGEAVTRNPQLTHAIARLLARRLQAVTAYLVDLKRQYADSDTHLAVMDQVLADLMRLQPGAPAVPGSERKDVPDY